MDNQQMKVDAYGRFIHVPEYPEGYTDPNFKQPTEPPVAMSTFPLTEPAWGEAEEVWARTDRVKRLEDTVIMLTDRVNQCTIRIAALEISPLERVPEESKSIGNIAEPPRERVCDSCKWGGARTHIVEERVVCHYEPQGSTPLKSWWCSKWEEK